MKDAKKLLPNLKSNKSSTTLPTPKSGTPKLLTAKLKPS